MAKKNTEEKRTTMTISILESDKALLQKHAIDVKKTSSALIHEWIQAFCAGCKGDEADVQKV